MESTAARLHRRSAGFTLIEVLVVVIILGVLAAIVVPQFVSAGSQARESSLRTDLQRMRVQIQLYRQQHNGEYPTLADFTNQLTLSSTEAGDTAAIGTAGYFNGPYVRDIPANPLTGGKTVGSGAVGTSDWYYDPDSGDFRANDSERTREF